MFNINKKWEAFTLAIRDRKLALFGAGKNAAAFINHNQHLNIEYICDNDVGKMGKKIMNVPIVSPTLLEGENSGNLVILITPTDYQSILDTDMFIIMKHICFLYNELIKPEGDYFTIHRTDLLEILDILADDESKRILLKVVENRTNGSQDYRDIYTTSQYFLPEMYEKCRCDNELIIDAGGLNGDTLKGFIDFFGKTINKIHVIEPIPEMIDSIKKVVEDNYNYKIIIHQLGLSNVNGQSSFVFRKSHLGGSHVCEQIPMVNEGLHDDTVITIDIKKLDDIIPSDERVTFIKMDIEGSEYKAIQGAKSIIQNHKPRLAICLYHSDEDHIRIPRLLKEMVPEYQLYIRHHQPSWGETVLYAFIEN